MKNLLVKTSLSGREHFTNFYYGRYRAEWFHGRIIQGLPLSFDLETGKYEASPESGNRVKRRIDTIWLGLQSAFLTIGNRGVISAHTHPTLTNEGLLQMFSDDKLPSDLHEPLLDSLQEVSVPLLSSVPSASDVSEFLKRSQMLDHYTMLVYGNGGMTLLVSDPSLISGDTRRVTAKLEEYREQLRISSPYELLAEFLDEERGVALGMLNDVVSDVGSVYFSPDLNSPVLSKVV